MLPLKEVATLAAARQMIPNAPVSASRSVEIVAPIAAVWNTLTDVEGWPKWYPYLKGARLHGSFASGTRLTYGGLFKHDLRLALVEAPRFAMIYGTLMGYIAITRWDLAPLGPAKTSVTFSESSDGVLIGSLYSGEKLGVHLQTWLQKLRTQMEAT